MWTTNILMSGPSLLVLYLIWGSRCLGSWEAKKIGLGPADICARVNQHLMAGSIGTSGVSERPSHPWTANFWYHDFRWNMIFPWAREKTTIKLRCFFASVFFCVFVRRSRPPYEGYWSPYRNGLRCGNFQRRSGWRDDGIFRDELMMRVAIFPVFFSKVFVVDSFKKSFLNKGRHFWWSHLSQGGVGVSFAFFPCFTFYLGNLEVSNWVSDWVCMYMILLV